ncbi:MAG: hypothetical protein PHT33_15605, partial [bacterium]|nr:hypothetical protein [bacterium]
MKQLIRSYYLFPCQESSPRMLENSQLRWRIRLPDEDTLSVAHLDGLEDPPGYPGERSGREFIIRGRGLRAGDWNWLGDSLAGTAVSAVAVDHVLKLRLPSGYSLEEIVDRRELPEGYPAGLLPACSLYAQDDGIILVSGNGEVLEPDVGEVIRRGRDYLASCPLCWAAQPDEFWQATWTLYRLCKYPADAVYPG